MTDLGYDFTYSQAAPGLIHLASMETVRSLPKGPFWYPKALCGIGPVWAVGLPEGVPICQECKDRRAGHGRGPKRGPAFKSRVTGHPGEPITPEENDERIRVRAYVGTHTTMAQESPSASLWGLVGPFKGG